MSRWERPLQGAEASSLTRNEFYPNTFAGTTRATDPGDGNNPDSNASKCGECGFNLEDRTLFKTCPHCGSDNFEGEPLTK